jgi:hypothetical protein
VFGEAELVATFTHPSGKTVNMSVIVRTSPGDTPAAKFFNGFVPYFVESQTTQVNLGETWSHGRYSRHSCVLRVYRNQPDSSVRTQRDMDCLLEHGIDGSVRLCETRKKCKARSASPRRGGRPSSHVLRCSGSHHTARRKTLP